MGRAMASRAGGFTLVELIASLSITVLVAAAAGTMWQTTASARQRIDRQSRAANEARVAMRMLTTALVNAARGEARGSLVMEGIDESVDGHSADRIRFRTVNLRQVRADQPESDVREVEFGLMRVDDEAQPVLVRRSDPTRNPDPDGGGVMERVARGVIALNIDYHNGFQWVPEWPVTAGALPMAVRIALAVTEGDQMRRTQLERCLVHFPHRPGPGDGDDDPSRPISPPPTHN